MAGRNRFDLVDLLYSIGGLPFFGEFCCFLFVAPLRPAMAQPYKTLAAQKAKRGSTYFIVCCTS